MPTQKQFLDNVGLTELLEELGQHLKNKLNKLTFDSTPTANSNNPVTSGGIKEYVDDAIEATEDTLVIECSGDLIEDSEMSFDFQEALTITNGITYDDVIDAYESGKKIVIKHTIALQSLNPLIGNPVITATITSFNVKNSDGNYIIWGRGAVTSDAATLILNKKEILYTFIVATDENNPSDNMLFVTGGNLNVPSAKIDTTNENAKLVLAGELIEGDPFEPIFRYDSSDPTTASPTVAYLSDLESITSMTEITYSDLVTARNNNNLKPGTWYRITDYATTTTQANTQSAGHNFDVIVLATSSNTLSEEARAIKHAGDTYFVNSNLNAWKVWYCLDNDTTRFAWADDASEKSITPSNDESSYVRDSNEDVGGLYAWTNDDSGDSIYTKSPNPIIGDELYDNEGTSMQDTIALISGFGRGVIYRLIDEFNNDCPYDFKNIQFANEVYFPDSGLLKLKFEKFDPHTSETTLNMYFYTFSLLNWETTTEHDDLSGEDITTSTFKNITDLSFGQITDTNQLTGMSLTLLGAYNNKIERPKMTLYQDEGYDEGRMETTESLPNNIILVDTIGEVSNCIFKDRAHNCLIYPIGKILNNIYDTEIGESCYNICIKSPGSDIKIARTCHDISISVSGVNRIHIGSSSNNLNLIADGISNLIIGQQSKYIKTLGDHINYVNIGNACSDISILNAESLLIGNKCSRIYILDTQTATIGDSCADIYFSEPPLDDNGTLITEVIPSNADYDLPGYMPSITYSGIGYKNIIIEPINEKIFVSRDSSTSGGYVYNLHILSYVGQPLSGTHSTTLSDYLQTANVITNTTSNLDTITLIHKNSLTISV